MNATAVVRAIEDALAECARKRHNVSALVMGKRAADAIRLQAQSMARNARINLDDDGSLSYGTIPFKPGAEHLAEWHGLPIVSAVHVGGVVQALIRSMP